MKLPSATLSEVLDSLRSHTDLIANYEPIDREAAWLQPANGVTAAQLETAIVAALEKQGWIVTSLKNNILIERRETRFTQSIQRGCLFHVSTKSNRAAIKRDGLKLGTGGNTRLERKYPERIFFALDLVAAFEFADFQCRRKTEPQPGMMVFEVDKTLLLDLDIWRVESSGIRLRHDVLFSNRGGWNDKPVPAGCVSRVRYWRQARTIWHFLRKRGCV